jgi:hypothetical protein
MQLRSEAMPLYFWPMLVAVAILAALAMALLVVMAGPTAHLI